MIVAASTDCFNEMPLNKALDKLVDLEYSAVEIALHENERHLRPTEVLADLDRAISLCRDTHRLDIVAYNLNIPLQGAAFYEQFAAICRLAKATKVVTLVVPSAELGTPFNEEVEHLQRMVDLASLEGARVAVRTEIGCLSEDPDTLIVLCDNVKGLGVTLDPSHFVMGPHRNKGYDKLLKYVYHVHLRDTSKDEIQVRIGQGEVEYGRLVAQLTRFNYDRALTVDLREIPDVDHMAEMRKMRLLLESLL